MSAAPIGFRPRAVLLDMDGLMLDSERALLACSREAAAGLGLHVEEAFWLSMIGLHERECEALMRRRFGSGPAEALQRRTHALYSARVDAGLPRKPGLDALLDLLDRHALSRAVVTSTLRERALRKLRVAGLLERFEVVVTGSDIAHPKPAPDIYLLAARHLAVEPACCVAVEDSLPGVRAALAAGMAVIQVPDLVEPDAADRARGQRIVESLGDVHALLAAALGPG